MTSPTLKVSRSTLTVDIDDSESYGRPYYALVISHYVDSVVITEITGRNTISCSALLAFEKC